MTLSPANSEYERILKIRRHLAGDLSALLVDDYKGIAIHSNSIIVDANEYCVNMFGYSMDEIVGLNAWTLFTPGSAELLTKHLMSKSEAPYQVTARRKDGSTFKIELKGRDSELAGEPIRTVLLKQVEK